MKRLTLIRHAKSDWGDIALADFDRPLNPRGQKAAPLMGLQMLQRADNPEVLISSPARRARETAELIAAVLEIPEAKIWYQPEIYEAEEDDLIQLIRELQKHEHIALVGHNPGISDLAAWLCPDAPGHMPTCAVLSLELNVETWNIAREGCGRILDYNYPKKTR